MGLSSFSHDLVRTVLRDSRCHIAPGRNLAAAGVTSGPLEIAEALKAVTHRFINGRRAGAEPWKPQTLLTGPTSLPITFDM